MSHTHSNVAPPSLVLIVDNDESTRDMYAERLIFAGFRVIQAAAIDDAMEKAIQLRPDVITTDLGRSTEDGCNLCTLLKGDTRTRQIPVLAVTAWATGGYIERARGAGCDSVLIKPCLPDVFLAEIQRLLQHADLKK